MKTRVLLVKEVRNRFSDLFGVPEKRVTAKFVGREREFKRPDPQWKLSCCRLSPDQ